MFYETLEYFLDENATGSSPLSPPPYFDQRSNVTTGDYHEVQAIATLAISALLIPVNGLLIGALCRPNLIHQPMTWLFIHLATFDIIFLITRLAWNYDQQSDDQGAGVGQDGAGCSNGDLFLRIMEKTSEVSSGYMTAAIAALRAVVVWRSHRALYSRLTCKIVGIVSLCITAASLIGTSSLVLLSCGKVIGCADGVNPLYGPPQAAHSMGQLLLVNVPVFVSYTYVCVSLVRSYLKLRTNMAANHKPHLRTLKYLVPYTLLYTLLTTPSHLNFVIHPGCLRSNENSEDEVRLDNVINTIWLIAVSGLNPLLLYFCNETLRDSVAAVIFPLRSCRSDRSNSTTEAGGRRRVAAEEEPDEPICVSGT